MLSTSRCSEGPGGGTFWHKHVSERGPAGTLVSLESKGERGGAERLGGGGGCRLRSCWWTTAKSARLENDGKHFSSFKIGL